MRAVRFAVPLAVVLTLAGCGYVGPVVPPSPEIPNAIADLSAVERGDQLVITFTTPPRTTDNLAIRRFSEIDLRIGPTVTPFDFERWSGSATPYELPLPPANDPDDPKPFPVSKTVPASSWIGKRVDILVRTSVKKSAHYSQWSNRVVLNVIPPLEPPVIEAKATKDGYLITWAPDPAASRYQVFRRGPTDAAPVALGTADASPYLDATSKWDTRYTYTVVAQKDSAESLPSQPQSIESPDIFPPAVPASLTALAGPESIELSWSRSPDADLHGYYVYRSLDGGPSQRVGDLLTLPAFSDRDLQHGHTYSYAVTAIDQKGNESHKSISASISY